MCKTSKDPSVIITDPEAQYKNWANQQQRTAYTNLQPYASNLLGTYGANLGKTDFTSSMPQLTQDVMKSVQSDIEGGQGPYTSLKKNLLGTYDTGYQQNVQDPLMQQLMRQGLYTSGPGMDVLAKAGIQGAQQRALMGSQVDVDLLNMANQLGQQQFQNNQLMGFTNPMLALQLYQALSTPAQPQEPDYTVQQQPTFWGDMMGMGIGNQIGNVAGSAINANASANNTNALIKALLATQGGGTGNIMGTSNIANNPFALASIGSNFGGQPIANPADIAMLLGSPYGLQ